MITHPLDNLDHDAISTNRLLDDNQLDGPLQRITKNWALGRLAAVALAVSGATANIVVFDPWRESRRSGACSLAWNMRRSLGSKISAREAREIAFQILRVAEQELQRERIAESRLYLEDWDDESV